MDLDAAVEPVLVVARKFAHEIDVDARFRMKLSMPFDPPGCSDSRCQRRQAGWVLVRMSW